MASLKDVTVFVPEGLNLEQAKTVLANILSNVGHPNCKSGHRIAFESAVTDSKKYLAVDPKTLAVHGVIR